MQTGQSVSLLLPAFWGTLQCFLQVSSLKPSRQKRNVFCTVPVPALQTEYRQVDLKLKTSSTSLSKWSWLSSIVFQIQEHKICWKGTWLSQNSCQLIISLSKSLLLFSSWNQKNCSFSSWGADGGSYSSWMFHSILISEISRLTNKKGKSLLSLILYSFNPTLGTWPSHTAKSVCLTIAVKNIWADLDQW